MPEDRLRRRTRAWLVSPFQAFARTEAAGGILLLASAVLALAWANSPMSGSYFSLWSTRLTIGVGEAGLSKPLQLWVNDGLMALFFLLVGLEIKREVLVGELASPRQAALPLAAAVGGMIVPAAVYLVFNAGTETAGGWAVPMATDIAFALGIMALLGSRVPTALKVFLTALAIADDLAAVLVIAVFYTAELAVLPLAAAAVVLLLLVTLNRAGARHLGLYLVLGAVLWFAVLKSGVHATVAGVLLSLTIPARPGTDLASFSRRARQVLDLLEAESGDRPSSDTMDAIHGLEVASSELDTPLARLEHSLHPWSAYVIMPLFALANAGVEVGAESLAGLASPAGIGVVTGLFLGKQIGVTGFAWLAVRTGLARRSEGMSWRQIHGVACLCGIGFTMSLFIGGLAFPAGSPILDGTKLAILLGSLLSGLAGWTLLSRPSTDVLTRSGRAARTSANPDAAAPHPRTG